MAIQHHRKPGGSLDGATTTAYPSVSADAVGLLEAGLAAEQAARRHRQAHWDRRRDRLIRQVDGGRRGLGYGVAIGGALLAVEAAGFVLALQFGLRDLSGVQLMGFGFTAVIVLVTLLLRTLISAVGEAIERSGRRWPQCKSSELLSGSSELFA